SNVILTKTGTKLLDFGLAKLRQLTPPSHVVSTSLPTRMDDTTPGVILGTLQYMAPEQLEGKDADARTDIFGFGLLLYEMLTGRKAFEGKSRASLIGAIMTTEPPPVSKALSPSPPALDHVVKKCLAKDPEERWQSAKDLMAELQWTSETHVTTAALDRPRKNASAWMVPLLSMAVVVLAVIAFAPKLLQVRDQSSMGAIRFLVPGPTSPTATDIALSPDGRWIAFVAFTAEKRTALFVRPIDSVTPK